MNNAALHDDYEHPTVYDAKILFPRKIENTDTVKVSGEYIINWDLYSEKDSINKNRLINIYLNENIDQQDYVQETSIKNNNVLIAKRVEPITYIPESSSHTVSSRTYQKWEGVVEKIGAENFVARLFDLSREGYLEEAEFSKEEIDDDDDEMLFIGAVFYWYIGHRIEKGGQKFNTSKIIFRRLPIWTKKDIKEVEERVHDLKKKFHLD